MIVYCDIRECANNMNGKCNNLTETGEKAVSLHENVFGELICVDYEATDEVSE